MKGRITAVKKKLVANWSTKLESTHSSSLSLSNSVLSGLFCCWLTAQRTERHFTHTSHPTYLTVCMKKSHIVIWGAYGGFRLLTCHCLVLFEVLQHVPGLCMECAGLVQILSPLEFRGLAAGGRGRHGTRDLDWRNWIAPITFEENLLLPVFYQWSCSFCN